jgi:hypothetical protein
MRLTKFIAASNAINGLKQGACIKYNDDGSISYLCRYSNDKRHGESVSYISGGIYTILHHAHGGSYGKQTSYCGIIIEAQFVVTVWS